MRSSPRGSGGSSLTVTEGFVGSCAGAPIAAVVSSAGLSWVLFGEGGSVTAAAMTSGAAFCSASSAYAVAWISGAAGRRRRFRRGAEQTIGLATDRFAAAKIRRERCRRRFGHQLRRRHRCRKVCERFVADAERGKNAESTTQHHGRNQYRRDHQAYVRKHSTSSLNGSRDPAKHASHRTTDRR